MSPRKLSDLDREEIVQLYRTTEETTSTLANRYGVSSSTVSRFLKSQLSDSEYENLIQQKRLARVPGDYAKTSLQLPLDFEQSTSFSSPPPLKQPQEFPKTLDFTLERKYIEKKELEKKDLEKHEVKNDLEKHEVKNDLEPPPPPEIPVFAQTPEVFLEEYLEDEVDDLEELDEDDLEELDEDDLEELDEDDLEELDEDDLDALDEDDWAYEEEYTLNIPQALPKNVKVLPLSEANLPKTCYLVIDRSAELITRPLKEFAHLGKIPQEEVQQKTLPVFDNQRIARRFSNRSQRVIKVPDARILKKTSSYLKAKGITRILINGQVYSLSPF